MAKPGNLIKIPISFDAAISAALKVKPEPKVKAEKPTLGTKTRADKRPARRK